MIGAALWKPGSGRLRVLLTGHLGYLGTRLAPMLRAAGIEVVGLDNGLFRDCAIGPLEAIPAIEMDIRDVDADDLSSFDAVVHLAGVSSESLGHIHPAITFEVNFEATVRLAELAKQTGTARFLFASSTDIYGPGSSGRGEGAGTAAESPYAVSKALAEEELARLAGDSFSPVFLRSAQPYGVSAMFRFEPVLNNLVAQAAIDHRILIDGGSARRLDLIHVEDVARAYLAVLEAPRKAIHRQAFNIGVTGECYTVEELAGFVRETVPGAAIEACAEGNRRGGDGLARFDKIRRMLPDYRPRWTARRGAVEIFEAVDRLALRRADIDGARFNRVNHLKMLARLGRLDEELRLTTPGRMSAVSQAG
ncbi:MAG TPA: SDR family oxidoreductase [Alphaproteobacteria bacterium]|nr:SDR family oxidoreductase [Alphaproteobacteria bacterium]